MRNQFEVGSTNGIETPLGKSIELLGKRDALGLVTHFRGMISAMTLLAGLTIFLYRANL